MSEGRWLAICPFSRMNETACRVTNSRPPDSIDTTHIRCSTQGKTGL